MRSTLLHNLAAVAAVLLASSQAQAQITAPLNPADQTIQEIDIVEHLGETIPKDLVFKDTDGKPVKLGDLLVEGQPVVLTLVYYKCPMLCNLVLGGLNKAAKGTQLSLGEDFRAITVSIDPRETPELAAERQRGHLQALGQGEKRAEWAFLTGEQPQIKALADAVGFKYKFDPVSNQFAHGAAVMILSPEGKISRYLYGIEYNPRDLKFALLEAAGGRVGTSFDRIVMKCFKYDPATRRYDLYISGFIKGGALMVFFALATTLAVFWRREYKRGTIS